MCRQEREPFQRFRDTSLVSQFEEDSESLREQGMCGCIVSLFAGKIAEICEGPGQAPSISSPAERVRALLIETTGFREVTSIMSYIAQVVDRPGYANPVSEF